MALIVTAEYLARRLGLAQPLSENDTWVLEEAISDAQTDLEAYLGRGLTPREFTEYGLLPRAFGETWDLTEYPLLEIISTEAEVDSAGRPTGYFTVTYVAGLDARNDPDLAPARRYVTVHAMYLPSVRALHRRLAPEETRQIESMSVEGQSLTYNDPYEASGQPGAPGTLPTLASCDKWRLAGRRVYQRPPSVDSGAPWPYDAYPWYI